MLSVAALLNHDQPGPSRRGTPLPSSPTSSVYTASSSLDTPHVSSQTSFKKQKTSKDGAIFAKGKTIGVVNYPPFEQLDEASLREVHRFRVFPMGKIAEYCRHIPYNSEKKAFLEKTGRESFEVFQYTFKLPGDDKEYTVMWDYNIGLVRITPFFKCCQYSKTTPAKMLSVNPGLKDITHSITGGALAAQGYWMPFSCALAICSTFCAHFAPALVPIFGPGFPLECVPPEAPEHGRFVIDRSIITAATIEAENYRIQYSNMGFTSTPTTVSRGSFSPQLSSNTTLSRPIAPQLGRRLGIKRALQAGEYTLGMNAGTPTPADTEMDYAGSEVSSERVISPATPTSSVGSPGFRAQHSGWCATNSNSHQAKSRGPITPRQMKVVPDTNPWLSSISKSTGESGGEETSNFTAPRWKSVKRRVAAIEYLDDGDEVGDEPPGMTEARLKNIERTEDAKDDTMDHNAIGPDERNAALLLMRLSMQDWEMGQARRRGLQVQATSANNDAAQQPKTKRRKGLSV